MSPAARKATVRAGAAAAKAATKAAKKPDTFTKVEVKGKKRDGSAGTVTVTVDQPNALVQVQWMIGTPMRFTVDNLCTAIEQTEQVNGLYPEVLMDLVDSNQHAYIARIAGGRLWADEKVGDEMPTVSWREMKAALKKAMDFLTTHDPKASKVST